ncbi:MAG: GNAT family N-acetyltransferase [Acidimicrobiia bacterium]|nr:GNAT family N-acetyltransferase [Acidimicrobiia bacterium]MYC57252.1 GNAT family N-acetyltransferase [Acidimicrobiia bacterium]MYG94456.1 GNAT family N-acetyltransferase [Acidimicrobiia bacterium]MYI30958.1 GNAT family N-acetyltransferase [Acidimicrobiia bacterium]
MLKGARVELRPLVDADFVEWQAVRRANREWLVPWEPLASPTQPDVVEDRFAFAGRCSARDHERQMDAGYGFGVFAAGRLVGEMNLSGVQRGPFQSGHVGYWIDQRYAGRQYAPEALVVVLDYAFEALGLHRVQVDIIPRNHASQRVVEKLGLRSEGVALRYLEINGRWEDHIRYAITSEEWQVRGPELVAAWLS